MKMPVPVFFALASLALAACTPSSLPFAVREKGSTIYSTATLTKHDLLQIRTARMLADETLLLARCTDAACTQAEVAAVWRHGFHDGTGIPSPYDHFRVTQDGRYFFQLVKNSDCYVYRLDCRNNAFPGVISYGRPQLMPIVKTANSDTWFMAKFDSGSLLYARVLNFSQSG